MLNRLLDRITMFRLTAYYLGGLLLAALAAGVLGWLPADGAGPLALVQTTSVLIAVALLANWAFSKVFRTGGNWESTLITALILALVLSPASTTEPLRLGFMGAAAFLAIASKYLLVWGRRHVFNPVIVGVLLTGLLFQEYASWWVGQTLLLPLVALGGLLVVIKTRRGFLVGFFLVVYSVLAVGNGLVQGLALPEALQNLVLLFGSTEKVFLAVVMLTEPITSPRTKGRQMVYAVIVAFFALPQLSLFGFNFSPEWALALGNVASWFMNPQTRHRVTLTRKTELAPGLWEFAFRTTGTLNYRPGQSMEWTLPGASDQRGNRRVFSLSSAPGEAVVAFGVRIPARPSAFKARLLELAPGDTMWASELWGDFVLPRKLQRPLVLIGGGVGVTPFRSMVQDMLDRQERRPLTLLLSYRNKSDQLYADVFGEAASTLGAQTFTTITSEQGRLGASQIVAQVDQPRQAVYYLSGTSGFVAHLRRELARLGVPRWRIRSDLFSGYSAPS